MNENAIHGAPKKIDNAELLAEKTKKKLEEAA